MDDITYECFENFVSKETEFKEVFLDENVINSVTYHLKEDETPVTHIDFLIEKSLRKSISKKFPTHAIVGEEFEDISGKSFYKWIIDPIDGTFALTKGVPLFGILVGLMYRDIPLYGCIRFPLLEKLICGNSQISFENGEAICCDNYTPLNESLILTSDEKRINASKYKANWLQLNSLVSSHRTWGDCYGYYLVCTGKAQVMFDLDLKPCDILPLIPIIQGAGCEIIELEKPYKDIIVCSKGLKQEILDFF